MPSSPLHRLFSRFCTRHSEPSRSPQASPLPSQSPSYPGSPPPTSYRHLSTLDVCLLTQILSSHPYPSPGPNNLHHRHRRPSSPPISPTTVAPPPTTSTPTSTTTLISTLPPRLLVEAPQTPVFPFLLPPRQHRSANRNDGGGGDLCPSHRPLNPDPMHNLLRFVRKEVVERGPQPFSLVDHREEVRHPDGAQSAVDERAWKKVRDALTWARDAVFGDGFLEDEGQCEGYCEDGGVALLRGAAGLGVGGGGGRWTDAGERGVDGDEDRGSSAWSDWPPSSYSTFLREPRWDGQGRGGGYCPACVLARVGGEMDVVVALRVCLLARYRGERLRTSKRLKWVNGWLSWSCWWHVGGSEEDAKALLAKQVRESDDLGRILKEKIKRAKRSGRVSLDGERREVDVALPSPSSVYSWDVSG